VLQAVSAGVLSVFILVGLVMLDPVLVGGVLAVVGSSYVIMSLSVRKRLDINSQTIAAKEYGRILLVQESMGGIRDIILRGVQPFYLGRYRDTEQSLRRSKAVNNFIAIMPRTLIEAIGITVIALAAYFISAQPGGVVGALPVLGALALGAQRLMPQAQIMYTGWALLVGNQAVLREVADAFAPYDKTAADEAATAALLASPIAFEREVKLDAVRFKYETRPKPALDGVTLSIVKGERLGIVGKTGSGKSTLVDILMGLVSPGEGSLSVDGRVLTDADLVNWRRRIAHVPQSIYFNDASVASNIAFGIHADEIDMDRVRDAARRAKIAEFLEGLDHGYDTVVGERGVQLSGGQRQRIAIARAFYFNDTDIFVFDEATSALDTQTERDVISALDDIAEDVTVIMIAHRVITLERCDRIVHMANGHITHIGPPSELDTAATA
jgi:ABC-type multidrug transport system fused ATPase/permease subunit